MKRPHRRAHLIVWLILAPLAGLGLFTALSARKAPPVEPFAPETVGGETR